MKESSDQESFARLCQPETQSIRHLFCSPRSAADAMDNAMDNATLASSPYSGFDSLMSWTRRFRFELQSDVSSRMLSASRCMYWK